MSVSTHKVQFPHLVREVRLAGTRAPAGDVSEQKAREREQAAYERGRHDAEQALQEQLLRQRNEFSELQAGVLDSLRRAVPQIVREGEQTLAALAVEIAQRLVAGMEVSVEMIEAAVRECLAQVSEATEHHVHLHPDDLDALQRADSQLLAPAGNSQRLHFHRAPEVTRGGCLVKTRFGVVDGQRETKVELLKKALAA